MKKFGLLLLTAVFTAAFGTAAFAAEAVPSNAKVRILGREMTFEAYTIDGYTYFKLRDLADALGFDVLWDAEAKMISVSEKSAEEPVSAETENEEPVSETITVEKLVLRINAERKNAGLKPLIMNDRVMEAAAMWAEEIQERYISYRPDGRFALTVLDDVGAGYSAAAMHQAYDHHSVQGIMEEWMETNACYGDLLSDEFTKVGVAYNEKEDCWIIIFAG